MSCLLLLLRFCCNPQMKLKLLGIVLQDNICNLLHHNRWKYVFVRPCKKNPVNSSVKMFDPWSLFMPKWPWMRLLITGEHLISSFLSEFGCEQLNQFSVTHAHTLIFFNAMYQCSSKYPPKLFSHRGQLSCLQCQILTAYDPGLQEVSLLFISASHKKNLS